MEGKKVLNERHVETEGQKHAEKSSTKEDGKKEGWICRNGHSAPCKRRTNNFGDPVENAFCSTNELAVSFKLNTLETIVDEGISIFSLHD